jgi:hypothetical protein
VTSASSTSSSKHARSIDDDTTLSEKDATTPGLSESRQSKRSKHGPAAAISNQADANSPIDQLIPTVSTTTGSDKITPPTSHGTPGLLSTTTTTIVSQDQPIPSLSSTPSSSSSSSTSSLQQQQQQQQQQRQLQQPGQTDTETQAKSTSATAAVDSEAARPLCFGMIQSLVVTLYPRHLEFEEGKSDPVFIRRATTANKASLAVEHEAGLVSNFSRGFFLLVTLATLSSCPFVCQMFSPFSLFG